METESLIVRKTTFAERMRERTSNWITGISLFVGSVTGLKTPLSFQQFAPFQVAAAKAALEDNPDLYAALERRSLTIATLPIQIYESDSADSDTVDESSMWVRKFRRLLKRPCYEDEALDFPFLCGKEVHAQLIADLLLCGTCAIHFVYSKKGEIIGYERIDVAELRFDPNERLYYRVIDGDLFNRYYFKRGTIATVRTISTDPYLAFGIGSYKPIRYIVTAAIDAVKLLAKQAQQGALSFILSAKNEQGVAMLNDKATRDRLTSETKKILKEGNGFGVFPGMLDVTPVSVKPADLQTVQLTENAAKSVLNATGTAAIALGNSAVNFAAGTVQVRVQAELDMAIAALFCDKFLTPLAQQIAKANKVAGYSTLECDIDFSGTYAFTTQRTDALNRAEKLYEFGADPLDALYAEQIYNVKLSNEPRFKSKAVTTKTPGLDESTVLGEGVADGRPDKQTV